MLKGTSRSISQGIIDALTLILILGVFVMLAVIVFASAGVLPVVLQGLFGMSL